ncbi:MAG: amidohydrolase family protein [Pseudonocardia sp.]
MPALDGVELLDHHCHGVVAGDLERPAFESLLTEAATGGGRDRFDSMLGLAVRRWCAPVLDLAPHSGADAYLERRSALGWTEVTRRLLRASGARTWLVDTGYTQLPLTDPDQLAALGGGRAHHVTRLETVAERVGPAVDASVGAAGWSDAAERAVRAEAANAVGLKTVVAYRSGLAVPPDPPSAAEVAHAAGQWLRSGDTADDTADDAGGGSGSPARIADPVLGAWLVHLGVRLSAELGLPLQVHTGFGDPDVRLSSANPALLTDLLAASAPSGARLMLLHCWPYQREAGYLANMFDHVGVDVGLAVPHVGVRAQEVLAELLELAPFSSVCFSSDGYGLPELHFLGALLWRRALDRLLDEWVREDVITVRDCERLVDGVAHRNARSMYPLATASRQAF